MRAFLLVLVMSSAPAIAASADEATPTPIAEPTPEATAVPEPTQITTPIAEPTPTPIAEPTPSPTPERESELGEVLPRRPGVAALTAALFPGLGHVYLKRPGRGAVFLAAETAELGAIITTITTSGWDPEDPTDTRYQRALLPTAWLQNTHLLGVYDAWRIARSRAPEGTYATGVPTPDTPGMLLAPFSGKQLTRPAVMIPLAAVWATGITIGLAADGGEAKYTELTRIPVFSREVSREQAMGVAFAYYTTTFYSVGIGEEALFRGVILTALEERWGPTWGWIASTAIFGLLHAANGSTLGESAIAVGATSIIGGYLGWLYQRDDHDLTGAVFFHTWYDVGIGMTTFLLDPEHQPFTARFSIPF